jgi:serine/threonine protein kinase
VTRTLNDFTLDHLRHVVQDDTPDDPRYRITQRIGQGGMGTVYLAEDRALGRPVALKVIRDGVLDKESIDRVFREARIIARLEHPGIVPVHDIGTLADGRVYYVMKWVKGRRLDEHFDASAGLPERLRVFQRVCETVAFAHAHRVIHRDLKPQNVMVGPFGEVLVLDWGVAKVAPDPAANAPPGVSIPQDQPPETNPRQTAYGTILGTPAYMSPEQALGAVDRIDERSDVFALGGVLYFLLTGQAPRAVAKSGDGELPLVQPRQRNRAVPRRLEAICLKALSADPEHRYAAAAELAAEVVRFLDGQAVLAYREGLLERLGRWAWWYRTPILLVAAYLLMRALLAVWPRR